MKDSTNDLVFSDYEGFKAIGTGSGHGNGLKNKSATEIIIPEFFQGYKVIAITVAAFRDTNIESCFVSKFIKSILWSSFWNCQSLKYLTFDVNSELETLDYDLISDSKLASLRVYSD